MLSPAQVKEFSVGVQQRFEQVPFCQHLGIKIEHVDVEAVRLSLVMRPEFIGNPMTKILHGGVIAAVIDTAGGIMAVMGVLSKSPDVTPELINQLNKTSTIDMRIDFIRPGRGEQFVAEASILRAGNKIAVTQTRLSNDEGRELALGTASYLIG